MKKLQMEHRLQQNMNNNMSKKIMDLEKRANDEKNRRIQIED